MSKEQIRAQALSLGADLCGFASMERFAAAPAGFRPRDIWPQCQTLLAFGLALPKGLAEISPRLIYGHYNEYTSAKVDTIAFTLARYLEASYACTAIPLPCDSPYEYWDSALAEGRGLLSMKHAAVQAGLGVLGKNTLFMCERFGNLVTLGCVLTDLKLEPDQPARDLCRPGCRKCLDSCPVQAIGADTVNQQLCRNHTYGKTERGFGTVDCNLCRTVCPLGKGS